jgi:hypothetical protein
MMRAMTILFAVVLGLLAQTAARAADPRYPDWPCAQAKVPELSPAAVWEGPALTSVGEDWKNDPKIKDLVAKLAARRVPLEEAQKMAADFVSSGDGDKTRKGTLLFAGLFETLNQQRTEVMDGLERLTRRERELAEKIRSDRATLASLQDQPQPDQHKVEQLTNELDWTTRIFEDRRKATRYVCDVPTTIERRLFALGRAIQQAME